MHGVALCYNLARLRVTYVSVNIAGACYIASYGVAIATGEPTYSHETGDVYARMRNIKTSHHGFRLVYVFDRK